LAWREFLKGKRQKKDVQEFQFCLMDNILALHSELRSKTYRHGGYTHFKISDPKPRDIHKASVRDRLLHHAIYRLMYPFYDTIFISDSYSCRLRKGTHRAMNQFRAFGYKVSRNNTRTCWILKCDVRKFFASIDQRILLSILAERIPDRNILWLLGEVIGSFHSTAHGKGLPLGNLTSQLLVNIYMNEFDQFVKHELKVRYYIRYADDFVLLSRDKEYLSRTLRYIVVFLQEELQLELHPKKVSVRTLASGIDFLGWVHFPDHRVLRTTTKWRMLKRLPNLSGASRQSYLGLLRHGNTKKLQGALNLGHPSV
jgi:retron-type reverse transcriptase